MQLETTKDPFCAMRQVLHGNTSRPKQVDKVVIAETSYSTVRVEYDEARSEFQKALAAAQTPPA
jgi:hypothetical protein